MLKIKWCSNNTYKTAHGGHYFNKKNICTKCNKNYEDLLTDNSEEDGKVLSK